MNQKKIIIGVISGLVLGVAEMLLFGGQIDWVIIPAVIGAIIGFASTKSTLKAPLWLLGTVVGAAFFVIVAFRSGLWVDDIITGAITGLVIALIMQFVGKKLK
ncbi:MAG: hypothetical protein ACPGXL_03805 [Chitinophagales bacterium]